MYDTANSTCLNNVIDFVNQFVSDTGTAKVQLFEIKFLAQTHKVNQHRTMFLANLFVNVF